MDKKIKTYGITFFVVQLLISMKVFVTFSEMTAYAVSKSEFSLIREDLKEIKGDQKVILNKFMEIKK